jgi:hypothetical protein
MRRILLIGLITALAGLLLTVPAQAQVPGQYGPGVGQAPVTQKVGGSTPVAETYVSFLEVAQGARPAGMGDAYVAVADDINSVFWNVAGLTNMPRKKLQVNFNYTQWLVDSQFNSGAVGVNTDYGALAFSFITFGTPKIEERTIFKPEGTGSFLDNGSIAIGGAYAKKFTDRFSMGGQFRWIQEKLGLGYKFSTIDFAVGSNYYTGFRSLRFAMSLRNFGKDKVLLQESFIAAKMPMYFNMAVAAEVFGKKGDPAYFTGAFEGLYAVSFEKRAHFGGELWLRNMLALRGGYKWNYDAQDFTAGAGVKLKRGDRYLQADFAWVKFNKNFDAPLRFSVTGSF